MSVEETTVPAWKTAGGQVFTDKTKAEEADAREAIVATIEHRLNVRGIYLGDTVTFQITGVLRRIGERAHGLYVIGEGQWLGEIVIPSELALGIADSATKVVATPGDAQ